VPIIFGPHDRNVRDAIGQLRQADAVTTVSDAAQLADAVLRLLRDEALRRRQGEAARRVAEQNSRALEQVVPLLLRYLPPHDARAVGNA
jgi:3-deoxy-D-manno-octulosonic-acid transferase